jgi:hypothetical protein
VRIARPSGAGDEWAVDVVGLVVVLVSTVSLLSASRAAGGGQTSATGHRDVLLLGWSCRDGVGEEEDEGRLSFSHPAAVILRSFCYV